MLTVTHRPLTYHDYYSTPEHGPRYQLVEGELYMAPVPNRFHQEISRNLEFIFLKYLEKNPIGKIFDAPFDVQLTDVNVYQPDLVYLKREHYSLQTKQGITGAPDLAVEILSPKTADLDTGIKREVFTRCGLTELWIVDPDAKRVSVYHLRKNSETPEGVYGPEDTIVTPLMPGIEVDLGEVFKDDD